MKLQKIEKQLPQLKTQFLSKSNLQRQMGICDGRVSMHKEFLEVDLKLSEDKAEQMFSQIEFEVQAKLIKGDGIPEVELILKKEVCKQLAKALIKAFDSGGLL